MATTTFNEDLFFEVPTGQLEFRIGPTVETAEQYYAMAAMPADDFAPFIQTVSRMADEARAKTEEALSGDEPPDVKTAEETAAQVQRQIDTTVEALTMCCPDDTVKRIRENIQHGSEKPIPFPTLAKILQGLMRAYGLSGGEDEDEQKPGDSAERPTEPTSD